jgi:DNA-binding MarR family transcriptional regulator
LTFIGYGVIQAVNDGSLVRQSGMASKSKIETELDFLGALEEGDVVTQMTLSKRIAVSVGLINALLKRAISKGYVKAKTAPYKRYAYYVTPSGFAEKSRLVAEYLEISLGFFRQARRDFGLLFTRAQHAGQRRLIFAGAGELAEIAALAALEADVEVLGVLDPESNQSSVGGVSVLRDLEGLGDIDAVVVTDTRAPQEVFDRMRERFTDNQVLAPDFLRIARAPLDFKPKGLTKTR